MDAEDFYEEIDGNIVTRADKFMWCQSHGISIKDVNELAFTFTNSSEVGSSLFVFQIKIIIPDGNLIYEYKFNNSQSHTFRQAGGRTWTNAYEIVGSPRILRPGVTNNIIIKKENMDWVLSVNGFRYVRIKGVYNPTDMSISLAYPALDYIPDKSKLYITDFVRFRSLFTGLTLNGNDFQPKTVRTYFLNMTNNSNVNMKIGKALEFTSIKSLKDFNIRDEQTVDEQKPKPIPVPEPEVEKAPIPNPTPKPTPEPAPARDDDKQKVIEVDRPSVSPSIPNVDTVIKPGTVIDPKFQSFSKVKGIERYRLYNSEIEDIFSKCVAHYVKMGFDKTQAELIIFQMGVSFCTSKNSIGDLTLHLIWENESGKLIRIKKSDHVKYLNSLTKFPCNVERIVLRYYSERILDLLKSGVLIPASNHAKKRGVKQEFAYLVTDFFDFGKLKLSDQELQVVNSDLQYVLLKNKHRRSIVNVNQLY
uniref:Minor coat protein n=1 Tax=Soybean mild yellows Bangladesh virus TaxID=3074303 RepID=A0AA51UN19_9VIRU|nr:minor coat protein [Soybean mild yellows Bangladesh virus]